MNRRGFLVCAGASLGGGIVAPAQTPLPTQQVSVVDFGADPSARQDSTSAVRTAIAAAKARRAQTLLFPRGTYRLMSAQRIAMDFTRMSNFEINGSGSTLLMGQDARCISLTNASNVVIRDLTIDYDPLPFTQGLVTASDSDGFSLRVDSGFPVPAHMDLHAVGSYDRSLRIMATKPFIDFFPKISNVHAVGPTDLRVETAQSSPIAVGTVLVLRSKGVHDVIGIADSHRIAVRSVRMCSSYSAGVTASRSSDLGFEDLTIGAPTGSNRLLSTNADGMDFHNCSGALVIQRCSFQGMGDDAINLITEMWRLRRDPGGATTSILKLSGGPVVPAELSGTGSRLEILDPHDLHVLGYSTAVPAVNSVKAQIEEGKDPSTMGDALIVDPDLNPTAQILDCQFNGNRARALIAHKDIQVRNCTFRNTTLSAILLAPDSVYMEGPATRNVTIQSNHFSGCHYGSVDPEGSITIDVMHSYSRRTAIPDGEASNIKIIDNVFESCLTAAIACRSADQLVIDNNQIGPTWTDGDSSSSPRAMILSQLTNSTISNNVTNVPNSIVIEKSEHTTVSANDGFSISPH